MNSQLLFYGPFRGNACILVYERGETYALNLISARNLTFADLTDDNVAVLKPPLIMQRTAAGRCHRECPCAAWHRQCVGGLASNEGRRNVAHGRCQGIGITEAFV